MSDMERVKTEAAILYKLCFAKSGKYPGAYAVAHTQICDNDPLNLFVVQNGDIIMNVKITATRAPFVYEEEGCTSFGDKDRISVGRWNKIEATFQTFDKETLAVVTKKAKLKGIEARIFQHENCHLQGENIYKEYN